MSSLRLKSDPFPERCNLCNSRLKSVWITGRLAGSGGIRDMCVTCHRESGVGMGTGRGQMWEIKGKFNTWLNRDERRAVRIWG